MTKANVLLNRTLLSDLHLPKLIKRINKKLQKKYKVTLDTEIYLSGDLANYIQNMPEKITVCKSKYVPDKYHIKHALEQELEIKPKDWELNDSEYLANLVKSLREKDSIDAKKIIKYIKGKGLPFKAYKEIEYFGCSQEGMNSHYYASRFAKVPNVWKKKTVESIGKIIDAKQNKDTIKIGFHDEFYDMPYQIEHGSLFDTLYREVINTDGMPYEMKKTFTKISNGDGIMNMKI